MANAQSVVIDHQNLGAHLAEGFKTGNSLIENEQRHPPAVGIPTQRQVTPGQKNFATLSEGVPPVVESQRRQEHVTPPSASRQGRHPSLRRGAPSASRDARTR